MSATATIDDMLRADTIDSREVIERIEELGADPDALDDDEREELADLEAFAEECEGYAPDWHHGETIIADSFFTQYAEQLADDLGLTPNAFNAAEWPFCHIDWDAAADALKQDYTEVTLRGVDFWIR